MLTNRTEPKKTGNILTNNTIYSNCFFGGGYYCEHYWDKNLAKQLGKKRFRKMVQDWRKYQERMEIGLIKDKRKQNARADIYSR